MVETGMTALIQKWVGLTAGIWVEALAGSGTCFTLYSPLLKKVMQLNQVQLNNIGVAKDFGENVGLLPGFIINLLPAWAILLLGACLGTFGYGFLYLILSERISPLPYWQVPVLMLLATNASSFYNTAVLVTCMRNFPKSRGNVVGIIKGFIGLSAAVFTLIYKSALAEKPTNLLLLLTFAPMVVVLCVMYFIRPVTSPTGDYDPEEDEGFFFVCMVALGLAIYLFVMSIVENYVTLGSVVGWIALAVMCLFLLSLLAVPAKFLIDNIFRGGRKGFKLSEPLLGQRGEKMEEEGAESSDRRGSQKDFQSSSPEEEENESSVCLYPSPDVNGEEDPQTMLAVGEGAVGRKRRGPKRGEDFTLTEAFMELDFWLLFFTFFCGAGTGNTAINNLGQIGQAMGYSDVSVFVSLYSICNFLGRLGGGSISEYYVRQSAMPRPAVMLVAQGFMIIGHLLFAAGFSSSLLPGSILMGVATGMHYTIVAPTASELFGLRDFGMIFNFLCSGAPVSSLFFSGVIAGYFYDMEAAKEASGICLGAHCFRTTFLIMAGVCLAGMLANVLMTLRIYPVYEALYGAENVTSHMRNKSKKISSGSPKSPAVLYSRISSTKSHIRNKSREISI